MIRLIALVGFALAVATSSQAMTRAPLLQPDSLITQVREGCGPGMVMVNGQCTARAAVRQARRCLRWNGNACAAWQ
jgi:hypothetical protein